MRIAIALIMAAISAANLEQRAREVVFALAGRQYAELAQNFNPQMLAALPKEKLQSTFEQQIFPQTGAFQKIGDVHRSAQGGFEIFDLTSQFEKGTFDVRVVFDADKKIAGLFVKPANVIAPTKYADYQTKTNLRLPFDGEWTVFWGGRTKEQNYHVIAADQRFAYDFVITRDGVSHHDDAKLNPNYYCWNAPIYAPAAGIVTESVDGIADNVPGEMNPAHAAGNHIVIDHGNGEYSVLAHFRNGTVVPKVGDRVTRGMLIGRCGNSGNSSEPHLHYHLQNGPKFGTGAEGLPAQFVDYIADGKRVARGEPVRLEKILCVDAR